MTQNPFADPIPIPLMSSRRSACHPRSIQLQIEILPSLARCLNASGFSVR